jgi:hypothetical protein
MTRMRHARAWMCSSLVFGALAACGPASTPAEPEAEPTEDVVVSTRLGGANPSGGELAVIVDAWSDVTFTLTAPEPGDVTFEELDTKSEDVGGRQAFTAKYRWSASPGPHTLAPFCAEWKRGDQSGRVCSEPLWVDVGAPADRAQMADIAEPEPVGGVPKWAWFAAGAAVLVGAGWAFASRSAPADAGPAAPPIPPDEQALGRWAVVRQDTTITDEERALALSLIFREYAEAVLHFPATRWTTSETLQHLEQLSLLAADNVPRARRLLRATDRIKYAGDTPRSRLFDELDGDLRSFVTATRPARFSDREGA